MDTLQEKEALQNIPFREDGTVDLVELARVQLEAMVNQIMDWQADELCGERETGARYLGRRGARGVRHGDRLGGIPHAHELQAVNNQPIHTF